MQLSQHSSSRKFQAIAAILSRNIFVLINLIIYSVAILLLIFGDIQGGIFLVLITTSNIVISCVQEIGAWLALEKLQLLSTPKVIRINTDGTDSVILTEEIKTNDSIKLKIGDQIPCDGVLSSSHGFEVSEALITGESAAFLRKPGDKVYAGSIITSGTGVLKVEKIFSESRIALMTESVKKFTFILSPVQDSINIVIKYIGYALLLIILFVGVRGILINESSINIIQSIGALTSVLLPQGLVMIVTLFFLYGAVYMYRKNVLLQELNATEKIGRIKNLCVDKTGTLTDNNLVIENNYTAPDIDEKHASESVSAYIKSTGDSSQTIQAIKKLFTNGYTGTVIDDLSFSSSRQFGVVHVKDDLGERVILAGAPDVFLPYLSLEKDKEWIKKYIDNEAKFGKRIICFAQSDKNVLPQNLSGLKLKAISIYILNNNLRDGVKEAIQFFQNRGVTIRVISGDNPDTVQFMASLAGIKNSEKVVSGAEMEKWNAEDFIKNAHIYTIFARIKPEQKEKIIEALKIDGFTAMVGDGANDALAIKKADLGIAMFDGAQITRQIASIVLVKNSFVDLPSGVKLADNIIQKIEICASMFFNQTFLGFFFFVILATLGFSFPFTPLNVTFINYFTIGLPVAVIFYWLASQTNARVAIEKKSFLKRAIPFSLISAIFQTVVIMYSFYSSLEFRENRGPTSLVVLTFIVMGVIFFMFTSNLYGGQTTKVQWRQFLALAIFEIISVAVLIRIPFVAIFYDLKTSPLHSILELVPLVAVYALAQYVITRRFSTTQSFNFLNA